MKNPRLFQGIAIASAVLIVSYILYSKIDWQNVNQADSSTTHSGGILSYVPADTLFFYGGLEKASLKDSLEIYTAGYDWIINDTNLSNFLGEEQLTGKSPGEKMIAALAVEYMRLLQDIPHVAENLGIGDEIESAIYTVGAIPVLRLKLADATAFNTFISRAEQAVKVTPQKDQLNNPNGGITFSSYSFDRPDAAEPTESNLIIATDKEYALLTFATPLEDTAAKNIIMGVNKPDNSLATAPLLSDLKTKYGFHPAYLGYINHVEIMNGMTASDGNNFSRMLDTLTQLADKYKPETDDSQAPQSNATPDKKLLDDMRTPECRTELMAVANMWPRTVFGYTEFNVDTTPKKFLARMILESLDTDLLADLKTLRGFIPATIRQINEKPVFGFGLGLNVDALMPFLTKTLQSFSQNTYKCAFLFDAQQQLAGTNPAMAVGMMAGMAAGLQGVSASILEVDAAIDFSTQGSMPDVTNIDALLTISSSNPQGIVMLASNFMQGMPPLNIPADGTPIDFPIPLPLPEGKTAKLAIKGNHLVAYVGDKSERAANQLASNPLVANGLFAFNIDMGKYMKLVAQSLGQGSNENQDTESQGSQNQGSQNQSSQNQSAQNQSSQNELSLLNNMGNLESQVVESFDISDQGMVFEVQMTLK